MKNRTLFFIALSLSITLSLFSQTPTDLNRLFTKDQNFISRNNDFVDNAIYFKLNKTRLQDFYRQNDQTIKISLPLSDTDTVEMILEKFKIFTDNFILKTSNGKTISNYKKGKFYRGNLLTQLGHYEIQPAVY